MKAINETLLLLSNIDGVEVWYVAPNSMKSVYADVTFNQLPISKMYDIYKQVDVLVKMSRVEGMFGPPLEAFHAGSTAIVSKVTGYDEYISHEINSLVVEVDDFAQVRSYVESLRDDRNKLHRLKTNALGTAEKWPTKEKSARIFASICYSVLTSRNLGKLNRQETQSERASLASKKLFPVAFLGE
jgi:glycosyltransferase involved in cell wall biosynthesis